MPRIARPIPIERTVALVRYATAMAVAGRVIEIRGRNGGLGAAPVTAPQDLAGVNGVGGANGGEPPMSPIEKLEKLGLRNISREARDNFLDPVFERSEEMAELSKRLKGGNNAILIGDTGVGKTAIVEGLAQEWKAEEKTCFFSLGMKDLDRSVLEPQLKQIVETVQDAYRQGFSVYILMDELHLHEQAGVLELLKEPLARPGFQVIGATTTKEFYQYFNNDATKRRFGDPIKVEALTGDKLRRLVRNIIPVILERLKGAEKIEVPPRSRQSSIELSPLIIGRYPPDATIALLKEAIGSKRSQLGDLRRIVAETPKKLADDINDLIEYATDASTRAQLEGIWKSVIKIVTDYIESEILIDKVTEELAQSGCLTITEDDIRVQASKMAGLDLRKMDELAIQQLNEIEARIRTRFIGQDQAVEKVAGAITRYKTGRRKKKSPIATFLFTGPTGTGKTELAHTLAWLLFGNPDKVMEIDMTQCEGRGGKTLLFGPDPGFVGFDKTEGLLPGLLKKKENRHGVLFLDEIDKADKEVYESLLVMLDQGYVQNKKTGEKYSLEDIVVVMASNQGETEMIKPDQIRALAEKHIEEQLAAKRIALEEARGALAEAVSDYMRTERQKTVALAETELAELEATSAATKKLVIDKLIQENRQIAANSFKTQADVYGREKYPPAFLSRLELIPFDYLTDKDLSAIADIQLKNFIAQVERDQKLELVIGENEEEYIAVKEFVLARGTNLNKGARPLKQAIENHLDNPFSKWFTRALPSGEYIIKISIKDGQLAFEETKNKSERGRQMDISTIRGRRGIILRQIAELVAKEKEVEAPAITEILSPPQGFAKVELWFEENPLPGGDAKVQAERLAKLGDILTAEDRKQLGKDIFKLLRSENPGLLAVGLWLALKMKPLKEKPQIQSLTGHSQPLIAELAERALTKLSEATEYSTPSGSILVAPGNKEKVADNVSSLLAALEAQLAEENREAVRRAVNNLLYAAKEQQEKITDDARRELPLTLSWKLDRLGSVTIEIANSDTAEHPEGKRLAQFRQKYITGANRSLEVKTVDGETIFTFKILGRKVEETIGLPPITIMTMDNYLTPILEHLKVEEPEKSAALTAFLPEFLDQLQKIIGLLAADLKAIDKLIASHISVVNPNIKYLNDLLYDKVLEPAQREEIIKTLLGLDGAPALPATQVSYRRDGQVLTLQIAVSNLNGRGPLRNILDNILVLQPKELIEKIRALGGSYSPSLNKNELLFTIEMPV